MASRDKVRSRPKEIRNAKALRDYLIEQRFEAGLVLSGTEVKSIRAGKAQLNDSFARIDRGEVYLHHMHVSEYAFGNINNHKPYRPRKLLLKRREIRKIETEITGGGLALIPLRLYFKEGLIKVEVALAKGKKLYDKREDLRKKAHDLEMERALKRR